MKNITKNLLSLFIGFIAALILLELFLTFFNPFPITIKGNNIRLIPNVNRIYTIPSNNKVDSVIHYSTNNIGLRGSIYPENPEQFLKIVTVGGSTTECWFNGDDKTWPLLFEKKIKIKLPKIWLNNAGLGGHSTRMHLALLSEHIYKLRPDFVIFLTGINDIYLDEKNNFKIWNKVSITEKIKIFFLRFETVNTVKYIYRTFFSKAKKLNYGRIVDFQKFDTLTIKNSYIDSVVSAFKSSPIAKGYKLRLKQIVADCKNNNIHPILLTQPLAWGEGIDQQTGINLETIKLDSMNNARLQWMILNEMNQITLEVGSENNLIVVDLATKLPKNTKYFYDSMHFSNSGTEMIAEILYTDLIEKLENHYKYNLLIKPIN